MDELRNRLLSDVNWLRSQYPNEETINLIFNMFDEIIDKEIE
jgi:hypothetical protein